MNRSILVFSGLLLLQWGCMAPPEPVNSIPQPPPASSGMDFGELPMEDPTGQEGQACGPNGECDEGLTCVSLVCVNLNSVDEDENTTSGAGNAEDENETGDDESNEETDNSEETGQEEEGEEAEEESETGSGDGNEEDGTDNTPEEDPEDESNDTDDTTSDETDDVEEETSDGTDETTSGTVVEGEVCNTDTAVRYGQGDCIADHICVPSHVEGLGICRLSCAGFDADNNAQEDASLCSSDKTCQTLMPNTYNELNAELLEGNFAMACLEQVTDVVTPCYALYDDDACADGRACQIADYDIVVASDGTIQDYVFTELRCRQTCDFDEADVCTNGEVCIKSEDPVVGYEVVWEGDDPLTTGTEALMCTQTDCEDDDTNTYCSCADAYSCLSTTDGFAHCGRFASTGWCGNAVGLFNAADWAVATDLGWPSDKLCNELDENRLCDDSLFRDPSVDASLSCVSVSSTSNMGICMAFCEIPADPLSISAESAEATCPTGLECSKDLGVAMVFGPWVDSQGHVINRDDAQTCDPSVCLEGYECAACDVAGAHCGAVPIDSFGNTFNGCFLPYSFCQESSL